MALHGNYSVLHKTFARFNSGTTIANVRSNYNKSGSDLNRFSDPNHLKRSSIPLGASPPYSWSLPKLPGGAASRFNMNGVGAFTGTIIAARRGEAAISGVGSVTASLGLIVNASATIAGVGSVTSVINAVSGLAAGLSGSGSVTSGLNLRIPLASLITGTGSVSATMGGTARMEADITPFTELSPQSLATAVWDESTSEHVVSGSFGEKIKKDLTLSQFIALK